VSSIVASALKRVKWEQRMYWRNPPAAGFTFAFPLMFLVVFMAINGNNKVHLPGGTVKFAQYYVPAIIGFGVISACYTNLAFLISVRRENGILKRTRGTPLPPVSYLAGMVGHAIVVSVIITLLVLALGLVAYGVHWTGRYIGLAVTVASGAFAFSALGFTVSTLVPNEDSAPAIVNFVLFPLLFISGTFGTVSERSALGHVAAVFPIRHLNLLMQAVFNPFAHGTGVIARHVLVLLAWGVGGTIVAARRFRWDPRGG
jgi:ABC-2 type transport system permease protein